MISFRQFINESVNDAGIFKAIFVIGIPGAGKSYTVKQLKGVVSPKVVNTDVAAEFLSSKWGKRISAETWGEIKDTAHRITKNSLVQYLNGMLPLFIDGTSNDVSNILQRIGILESIGYDVGVVFVKTPLEVAIKRAADRAKKTGREVDEGFIRQVDSRNRENASYLKSKVGFFIEINNNNDSISNTEIEDAFKASLKFFTSKINNPIGKRHLEQLKNNSEKYLSPSIMPIEMIEKKVDGWYRT